MPVVYSGGCPGMASLHHHVSQFILVLRCMLFHVTPHGWARGTEFTPGSLRFQEDFRLRPPREWVLGEMQQIGPTLPWGYYS